MSKLYCGRTLAGDVVEVAVEDGRIVSVTPAQVEDPPLLAPPLVDAQQNGALGKAFNALHEDGETLARVATQVRRHGVGRMFATYTTYPYDLHLKSLAAMDAQLSADADLARLYAGVFFEGNYMSRETGWCGIHDAELMLDPTWDQWARLQDAAGGRIRIFNVDPDRPGALTTIAEAVKHGIRVAMGHCNPSAESIRRAADAGCDLVTHFGNGAAPMVHRHRNPFWTWLADQRLTLGIIADGFHLPDDLIRTVFACRSGRPDKVLLVSDASDHSGMPPGDYGDFVIDPDGRCHRKDADVLAGAWFQADRGVETLCRLGWPLADAWRRQSEVPAGIFGIDLPTIEVGRPAEFVLARWLGDGLRIEQVVAMGAELLDAPLRPRDV